MHRTIKYGTNELNWYLDIHLSHSTHKKYLNRTAHYHSIKKVFHLYHWLQVCSIWYRFLCDEFRLLYIWRNGLYLLATVPIPWSSISSVSSASSPISSSVTASSGPLLPLSSVSLDGVGAMISPTPAPSLLLPVVVDGYIVGGLALMLLLVLLVAGAGGSVCLVSTGLLMRHSDGIKTDEARISQLLVLRHWL